MVDFVNKRKVKIIIFLNQFFDNYFLNVNFPIIMACTDLRFCLFILHTHFERTESQMFYLGPGFNVVSQPRKHFVSYIKQNLGPKYKI